MPPQALLTTSSFAAQRLHHADGKRDLLERIALVEVKAAFHRHDGHAGELAADQPAAVADGRASAENAESPRIRARLLPRSAVTRLPSPVPRMMPACGVPFHDLRIYAAAASTFSKRPCMDG